jgi:hypothetical protein
MLRIHTLPRPVRHLPPPPAPLPPCPAPLPTPRPEIEPPLSPHDDYIRRTLVIGNLNMRLVSKKLRASTSHIRGRGRRVQHSIQHLSCQTSLSPHRPRCQTRMRGHRNPAFPRRPRPPPPRQLSRSNPPPAITTTLVDQHLSSAPPSSTRAKRRRSRPSSGPLVVPVDWAPSPTRFDTSPGRRPQSHSPPEADLNARTSQPSISSSPPPAAPLVSSPGRPPRPPSPAPLSSTSTSPLHHPRRPAPSAGVLGRAAGPRRSRRLGAFTCQALRSLSSTASQSVLGPRHRVPAAPRCGPGVQARLHPKPHRRRVHQHGSRPREARSECAHQPTMRGLLRSGAARPHRAFVGSSSDDSLRH